MLPSASYGGGGEGDLGGGGCDTGTLTGAGVGLGGDTGEAKNTSSFIDCDVRRGESLCSKGTGGDDDNGCRMALEADGSDPLCALDGDTGDR